MYDRGVDFVLGLIFFDRNQDARRIFKNPSIRRINNHPVTHSLERSCRANSELRKSGAMAQYLGQPGASLFDIEDHAQFLVLLAYG
jgi:hypothetical protein